MDSCICVHKMSSLSLFLCAYGLCLIYAARERPAGAVELMEKLADGQTDGGVSGGISNPRSACVLLNHCTAETEGEGEEEEEGDEEREQGGTEKRRWEGVGDTVGKRGKGMWIEGLKNSDAETKNKTWNALNVKTDGLSLIMLIWMWLSKLPFTLCKKNCGSFPQPAEVLTQPEGLFMFPEELSFHTKTPICWKVKQDTERRGWNQALGERGGETGEEE